ncbi:MAG: rod shape-determining protein MreD [Pseudomonadota bacterium]
MMLEGLSLARMLRMAGFVGLGFVAVSIEIAPVGLTASALPSPDLLFCLTAYCALRRPEAVPLLLVFAIGLMRDLLTDGPPGIGALILTLSALFLTESRTWFLNRPLLIEWLAISLIFALGLALHWVLVVASFAPAPLIAGLAWLVLATAAAYLPVALLLRLVLRIDYAPEFRRLGGAS